LQIQNKVLIENLNLQIESADRILITGENGSGKSVLATNLQSKQKPNIFGEVIYGSQYSTFILDQNLKLLDNGLNALENFQNIVKTISQEEIYKYLFSLNFNLENIKIPVENLSGGEKLKLIFAIINASEFDLLVLDEPNNNLDIDSKEVLISILNEYKGTFVLISHDKSFYSSIEINKEYEISNNRMTRK